MESIIRRHPCRNDFLNLVCFIDTDICYDVYDMLSYRDTDISRPIKTAHVLWKI